jgi:hypothetical protein
MKILRSEGFNLTIAALAAIAALIYILTGNIAQGAFWLAIAISFRLNILENKYKEVNVMIGPPGPQGPMGAQGLPAGWVQPQPQAPNYTHPYYPGTWTSATPNDKHYLPETPNDTPDLKK